MADEVAYAAARIAAKQAALALSELARFSADGETHTGLSGIFEIEVCELLADALKLSLQIEQGVNHDDNRNQLIGALDRFLEGWA